jgi:hypothetical protein
VVTEVGLDGNGSTIGLSRCLDSERGPVLPASRNGEAVRSGGSDRIQPLQSTLSGSA